MRERIEVVVAREQRGGRDAHARAAGLDDERLGAALAQPGDQPGRQRRARRDLVAVVRDAHVVERVELGRLERELPVAARQRDAGAAAARPTAEQESRPVRHDALHRDHGEIAEPDPVLVLLVALLAGHEHDRCAHIVVQLALDRGVHAPAVAGAEDRGALQRDRVRGHGRRERLRLVLGTQHLQAERRVERAEAGARERRPSRRTDGASRPGRARAPTSAAPRPRRCARAGGGAPWRRRRRA